MSFIDGLGAGGAIDAPALARLVRSAGRRLGREVGEAARDAHRRVRPQPDAAPTRVLRLAYGRINQETNAFSPVQTTTADFRRTHFHEGDDLAARCRWLGTEAPGFARNAELSGFVAGALGAAGARGVRVELVPLLSAWAVPSGPLTRACFDELVERMTDALRAAGPLDGIYLALHGAMGVVDLPLPESEGPESEIVRRIRDVVGGDVPLGVSLDLHGNVTRGLVERAQIVQGYRTNPHRDHAAIGARVGALLVRTALGEIRPRVAWRSLPMLLGGSPTLDFWAPMRPIFRRMDQLEEDDPRVLGATVMTVHPWNAHRELGWSTLVVTDDAPDLGEQHADALADLCWAVRDALPPTFAGPSEAIAAARALPRRPLRLAVLADASDVVSAGAPGDNTALLRALIDEGAGLVSYVPLRDPDLVDRLWREHRVGDRVEVSVGGTLDPERSEPLAVRAEILGLPRAHGVDRMAVLRIGDVRLVVVEGPALALSPAFYRNAGLRMRDAQVVVVKNFFPFLLFFAPYARLVRYVRTRGVTDFDIARGLEFTGPVHPKDAPAGWREADARRRGLGPSPG
jgi:microcystin degradation protein MlrC